MGGVERVRDGVGGGGVKGIGEHENMQDELERRGNESEEDVRRKRGRKKQRERQEEG